MDSQFKTTKFILESGIYEQVDEFRKHLNIQFE